MHGSRRAAQRMPYGLLRSAASPESVGFGRPGSDASGLLSTSLPAGHLFPETIVEIKRAPRRRPFVDLDTDRAYLILPSTNSTCFFAIGSYFFIFSFSVIVREFFLVT